MHTKNKWMVIISTTLLLSIACSFLGQANQPVRTSIDSSKNAQANESVNLELDDGASLRIPPNSLPKNAVISMQAIQNIVKSSEPFLPAGSLYEISFGGAELSTPAEITLPYDPLLLPEGATPEMLFTAYFDETKNEWIFAGGEVDQSRQVVRVQSNHASRWAVFSWNWDAWIALLNKVLEANVVSWIEAIDLLTNDCPQKGNTVWVKNVNLQNIIQGCVENENRFDAHVRVVNPKSFYYEIKFDSNDQINAFSKMLDPGESYEFDLDTHKLPPLSVRAEITQAAGYRLVVHLVLMMLPGFNSIEKQPHVVACLTERLHDVSYFASAAEALSDMDDLSGVAAGESIVNFFQDDAAVRRFLTASDDCVPNLAKTWSSAKISLIANLANVIISAGDYVANTAAMYFREETEAQVQFLWDQAVVDMSNPQSIMTTIQNVIDTGDVDVFKDMLNKDGVYYANYLEGGQEISNPEFLAELQKRIKYKPSCQGIDLSDNQLFIWYSDWQPAWQMTELCYAGCQPISPPHKSNTAAFMFRLDPELGKYVFRGMYQNTPINYYYFDNYSLQACNSSLPSVAPTRAPNCPGSPPQRLKIGDTAKVCTKKDSVFLRLNAGKASEKIASLEPGTTFTIVGGPECAGNNWSWWQVKLDNGLIGWVAEGGDNVDMYFICPIK